MFPRFGAILPRRGVAVIRHADFYRVTPDGDALVVCVSPASMWQALHLAAAEHEK